MTNCGIFGKIDCCTLIRFLSYKYIGSETPLIYKTIGLLIDESAEKFEDGIAYAQQNQKITFRELKEKVSFDFSRSLDYIYISTFNVFM